MASKSSKRARTRASKRGMSPGAPVYTGEPRSDNIRIHVLRYGPTGCESAEVHGAAGCLRPAPPYTTTWINIDGIHNAELVQAVCERFRVHPLAVEDVLNPSTRVKVDDYGEVLFVAAKMVNPPPAGQPFAVELEQLAVLMGPDWLITFQEQPGDCFDPIRRRIREGTGRIRSMGPDYLLHAVLDGLVDSYIELLQPLEDQVEELEEQALTHHARHVPRAAHALRSQVLTLRRALLPLRESVGALVRGDAQLIRPESRPFYRDLLDHIHQAMDILEGCRERLVGLVEIHLAINGHRMNEIMRVLTVLATVFIPLTFIVGVYGMNFDYMPELRWRWGYPAVLLFMGLLTAGMLRWFRTQRWI